MVASDRGPPLRSRDDQGVEVRRLFDTDRMTGVDRLVEMLNSRFVGVGNVAEFIDDWVIGRGPKDDGSIVGEAERSRGKHLASRPTRFGVRGIEEAVQRR